MSKFKFRLQNILNHKETIENISKGNYGKTRIILEQELEELENIKKMKHFISKEKENIVEEKTTIESLKTYNYYIVSMGEQIKKQNQKVEEAEHEVAKAREELIEATKEKKIMEKLKTRDYHEYIYEQKKEEEKFNDQFVSYSSSTNITGD